MSTLSRYYRTLTPSKIRVLKASGNWIKVILSHHDGLNHHHHDTNDANYTPHTHDNHVFYINKSHIPYIDELIPIRTGKHLHHDHNPVITQYDDGTIHYHVYYNHGHHHHQNESYTCHFD